ncbi:hypothetical protein COV49_01635 [Candidatus Falkowbacteria bacterium CG11_big_fil_rev_8_21_14_0_20_39_10]|uniref:Response regulatory domain-containing protein n=1 Tax=Candidatus Falkowbacteria bacterium CG11_big_fil_rev_8_21_14_0_20_39_10 TaxID=1974570 RepID=A0A2M6K9G4_9BACT|nr:MAG: hypothetical protein COV49_01635 [Candidatus Falkowbacteria bacterium CG11_big_fil_rev_8_21_14_0_20_39_10]
MRKKIFIIEDDANICSALQAKFSINGLEVEVNNGNTSIQELIKDIKKFKPDYMILDLILPRMDGFEVARIINQDPDTVDILIFVFTNLTDDDSRARGLELGVKHYFIKNEFNIDEFVEKIQKIIKNKTKTN